MKHGPDWYRNYKDPTIISTIMNDGPDAGKLMYSVKYYYDLQREKMEEEYSVLVGFYADTGEAWIIRFGDGIGYLIPAETEARSKEKPYVRPCPYPKPKGMSKW